MNSKLSIALLTATLQITACTVTGPADDGFLDSQESLVTGRVFSEDEAGFTVYDSRGTGIDDESATAGAAPTTPDFADLTAYEEWRRARDSNSTEYQKFRLWQKFEAFHLWQEQQLAQ